jgi:tripartite-type tricarboxylate transporter receptor subunit TctC
MFGRSRKGKMLWLYSLGVCLSFVFLSTLCLNISVAAEYPTKTIQIVVPFPPGGSVDSTARLIGNKISAILGQSVVVVNKAGGGSVIGTQAVAASPADGYTILAGSPTLILAQFVTKNVAFTFKDFTPVSLAVISPNIIAVKKDAPWLTLEELIAAAKKNPGKLTYGITGYGSMNHLAGELFKMTTGTDITCIPMDGTAPMLTALLGGHINLITNAVGEDYTLLKAGSVRALATMSKKRLADLPDVPTMIEKGFPKLIAASWFGYFVPAKTPRPIVEKIEKAFKEALKDKKVGEILAGQGWIVENLGSDETAKFLNEEQQKWLEVAREVKLVQK